MNDTERVRPSSGYYFLAAAFALGGIALMIVSFISGVYRIRQATVRSDIPGQMDLELKQGETYTVFVEQPNLATTANFSVSVAPRSVKCQVNAVPSGEPVLAQPQTGSSTYTYGTRRGMSVMEFVVPKDGTYMVACQGPSTISGEKVEFVLGAGVSKAIWQIAKRSLFVLFGGFVIGLLIVLRIVQLRMESRSEIRERGLKPV